MAPHYPTTDETDGMAAKIDYQALAFHPMSERIVDAICGKVNTKERGFFRVHVAYYMCIVAAMMRTKYKAPGERPEPVNMYAFNLAPSGFGKGHSTKLIENCVINQFETSFTEQTFELLASQHLPKIACKRAAKKATDPDVELERVIKDFEGQGSLVFAFDKPTQPAIRQYRTMLLMANAGSINMQIDEIGSNLTANKDAFTLMCELWNGDAKINLNKNTAESKRLENFKGSTPTNMMLFGVPNALLDNGKNEEDFNEMLANGFARRSFFGFITEEQAKEIVLLTPEDRLDREKRDDITKALETISEHLEKLVDMVNAHQTLAVPDDTALLYYQYDNECALRGLKFREHQLLLKYETRGRPMKAMKLAGAYAFVDGSSEILSEHYEAAIALAEESGKSFARLFKRDRAYVKLARFMAHVEEDVTQADLDHHLPFFKGSKSVKDEMITQAIAWGYKHNILIKKRFIDSIEFLRGETLRATDLEKLAVAYSTDLSHGYRNDFCNWDKLHQLTQADGYHWINHHVNDGHRHDDDIIPGFNLVVADVDGEVNLSMAKSLLRGYKALFYTTKSSTADVERFRIIFPTNYELDLDKEEFKEFMKNLFEWLPFESDEATGQRSRKWLSNAGHFEYTEGRVLDVLPFIPKTSKNEERKAQYRELQSLDNLERWVIQNTGDGNRNNQLLRYGYILVDGGYSGEDIQTCIMAMNAKLSDKLEEEEILTSIMVTMAKAISKRDAELEQESAAATD